MKTKLTRKQLWNAIKVNIIIRVYFWKFPKVINIDTGKIKWNKDYKHEWR